MTYKQQLIEWIESLQASQSDQASSLTSNYIITGYDVVSGHDYKHDKVGTEEALKGVEVDIFWKNAAEGIDGDHNASLRAVYRSQLTDLKRLIASGHDQFWIFIAKNPATGKKDLHFDGDSFESNNDAAFVFELNQDDEFISLYSGHTEEAIEPPISGWKGEDGSDYKVPPMLCEDSSSYKKKPSSANELHGLMHLEMEKHLLDSNVGYGKDIVDDNCLGLYGRSIEEFTESIQSCAFSCLTRTPEQINQMRHGLKVVDSYLSGETPPHPTWVPVINQIKKENNS